MTLKKNLIHNHYKTIFVSVRMACSSPDRAQGDLLEGSGFAMRSNRLWQKKQIIFLNFFLLFFPRRFPEGDEDLRHAIENAFDNLNAVGIPDVDLIDPSGQFSFSLWGVTSDFDFDRTWLLHNNSNQMDWVPRPSFPGLTAFYGILAYTRDGDLDRIKFSKLGIFARKM